MAFPQTSQQFIQSRWPWLAASLILTASLFVSATIGWFWYIDQRDSEARILSLDLLWLEQTITHNMDDNQHMMELWAHDLQRPTRANVDEFLKLSENLMHENPALIAIDFVNKDGTRVTGLPSYTERPAKLPPLTDPLVIEAMQRCIAMKKPIYSRVIEQYAPLWVLAIPVSDESSDMGVVLVTYDLDHVLSTQVPWWFVQRYDFGLVDRDNKQLAPRDNNFSAPVNDVSKLNFGPDNSGLFLRANWHSTDNTIGPLVWLSVAVIVFGILIIWLLRILQRWLRERLAAQQALANELQFRDAMEKSLVTGLIAFDKMGKIIYVNPGLCDMLGYTRQALLGLSAPFVFWPPEHALECADAHSAMLRGENPENGRRIHLMDVSGARLSVRLFASPLESGDRTGWMASLYDNTELQREREALASSREQLYAVLSGLDAAVFVSRISDAQLLFRNNHHDDLFQFQSDAECCLIGWPGVSRSIDFTSREFQDGARWFHLERRTILWVDNSPVLLDIVTDITIEHAAADTARERDELLQHTGRLATLAEFASGIAHELNQPLAAITNYSGVASTYLDSEPLQIEKIRKAVQSMGDESNRAGKIIHSMRNFIQKRSIQYDKHNLIALLEEPLILLQPLSQRLQFGILVQCNERHIEVDCDAVMIEQVIFNLIRNGLEAVSTKYQTHLPAAVTVSIERNLDNVTVCVADCGPGIDEPEKLFQPFYTTKSEGMGLGLAICRTVIESHGGRLWAEKNPNGGASFKFRLQCVPQSENIL